MNEQEPINPEKEKILLKIVKIKNLAKKLYRGACDLCGPTKKDDIEERLEQLKKIVKMTYEDPAIPQEIKRLPALLAKYADSCAREEEKSQVLAQIDPIIYTD